MARSPLAVLLAAAVLAATAACSQSDNAGDAAADESAAPTTISTVPSVTTTTLPMPWQPAPGEPEPELKRGAARAVQVLATYGRGEGSADATRARLERAGIEPSLAEAVAAVLDPDLEGSVEIVYPQLGGLTVSEASVMVVARLITGGQSVTRTFDVRAARGPAGWRVTAIASDGGTRPAKTEMVASDLALNERVDLPDSARWDLERGLVDQRIVEVLTALAETYELSVTVFGTGHPANVFGTDRTSNHTVGRGVDVWAVNGTPVSAQRESPTLRAVLDAALAMGVTEIGAPFDVDGRGGIVFTNTVHQDHLHLAFKR